MFARHRPLPYQWSHTASPQRAMQTRQGLQCTADSTAEGTPPACCTRIRAQNLEVRGRWWARAHLIRQDAAPLLLSRAPRASTSGPSDQRRGPQRCTAVGTATRAGTGPAQRKRRRNGSGDGGSGGGSGDGGGVCSSNDQKIAEERLHTRARSGWRALASTCAIKPRRHNAARDRGVMCRHRASVVTLAATCSGGRKKAVAGVAGEVMGAGRRRPLQQKRAGQRCG